MGVLGAAGAIPPAAPPGSEQRFGAGRQDLDADAEQQEGREAAHDACAPRLKPKRRITSGYEL